MDTAEGLVAWSQSGIQEENTGALLYLNSGIDLGEWNP